MKPALSRPASDNQWVRGLGLQKPCERLTPVLKIRSLLQAMKCFMFEMWEDLEDHGVSDDPALQQASLHPPLSQKTTFPLPS